MGNQFIELKKIARETLPRLIGNLVMPNLCHKDFSAEFADLGNKIQVKLPVILEGKDFTDGNQVVAQDITEQSVDIVLDKIATVDIELGALESANNMTEEKFIKDFIEPAAVALAEKINKAGLEMYKEIPDAIGTAGTTPSTLADLAAARKALNAKKVPMTGRVAVWDVEADAAFTQISNLTKVNEAGSPSALREGEIGRVYGLDNYMAQDVVSTTAGTLDGTPLIDHSGGYTKGATTIHIDGATTATAKVNAGDTLTIGGNSYVVVEDVTFASSEGDVKIYPGLKANVADNAAVTYKKGGTQNLVFHKNAIAFVTRPLAQAPGVDCYVTSGNGFSLRVTRGYDMKTKKAMASMDVLYSYKVVRPEMAVRFLG